MKVLIVLAIAICSVAAIDCGCGYGAAFGAGLPYTGALPYGAGYYGACGSPCDSPLLYGSGLSAAPLAGAAPLACGAPLAAAAPLACGAPLAAAAPLCADACGYPTGLGYSGALAGSCHYPASAPLVGDACGCAAPIISGPCGC